MQNSIKIAPMNSSMWGSRIRPKSTGMMFLALVIVLTLLPFISMIYSNLVFRVSYEGMEDLQDDYIAKWDAEDPRLIAHIRKNYLYPPSPRHEPYNLLFPNKKDWSHKRQSKIVNEILKGRKNGFFLEAGAYDGETYSNSLYFEKYLNWTGLLVEPDFANIKRLRTKNRKSWLIRGCLDGTSRPKKMTLYGAMETGSLSQYMDPARRLLTRIWRPVKYTQVWCFPMLSVLLAVDHTKVDYMVLDIEGSEIPVLQGTPWDKVDVDVLQVEYMVFHGMYWDKDISTGRRAEMRKFFAESLPQFQEHGVVFLDLIFAKKQLLSGSSKNTKHADAETV